MSLSGLAKVVLGFAIAIALLIGGSVAATLYLVAKITALPAKPVFDNTPPATQAASPPPQPKPQPTATPKPEPQPEPKETLPPGAYKARVTWPEGLLLRTSPDFNSASVGGIGFNQEAIVLESSADGRWQRVRIQGSGQEGWVVGGNTVEVN